MTDWWAMSNDPFEGGEGDIKNTAAMVRSQNDLFMVVTNDGAEVNSGEDNIPDALRSGNLTIGELQRCAMNICRYLMNAPVFGRKQPFNTKVNMYKPMGKEVADENIINVSEQTEMDIEKNSKSFVRVTKGCYMIIASMKHQALAQAQTSCNLFINDELAVTVQVNGTRENYLPVKLTKVMLEDGVYELRLQGMSDALYVRGIELRKIKE